MISEPEEADGHLDCLPGPPPPLPFREGLGQARLLAVVLLGKHTLSPPWELWGSRPMTRLFQGLGGREPPGTPAQHGPLTP